ncbi:MAG: hypothetical protein WAW78_15730, partial [Propioniciclava sp.]
ADGSGAAPLARAGRASSRDAGASGPSADRRMRYLFTSGVAQAYAGVPGALLDRWAAFAAREADR